MARKRWVFAIAIVFGLYGLLVVGLYSQQRNLLFHPPNLYLAPQAVGLEAREIILSQKGQPTLTAWWINPQENQPVIVFFHGNASGVFGQYEIYADLAAQGLGVLAVGYPGYPGSQGKPSEAALVKGAERHIEFLQDQGFSQKDIVYFGTSLGSGVASQLSLTYPPSLLVLDAPFYSIFDLVRLKIKLPGIAYWLKDPFHSNRALAKAEFPILILHGTRDTVIPDSQSAKLFAELPEPKTRHVIEGGGHTNLWYLGGKTVVLEAITTR